eukprot:gene25568-34132_t
MKYTCGTSSASSVFYEASDSTCSSTPKNSVPVINYEVCPSTTTLPKSVCLGATTASTLINSVKGVVYTLYTSESACLAQTSSAVTQIYFSKTGFDIEGVHPYECTVDSAGGSYAYVCNGANGMQQLHYSTTDCKGASTLLQQGTFQQFGLQCSFNSDASAYYYPTCYGPSNMN